MARENEGDSVKTAVAALEEALSTDSSSSGKKRERISTNINHYETVEEFDAKQQLLPDSLRFHGAEKIIYRRIISIRQKYGTNATKAIIEIFKHNVPKLMFILLPIFALFMTWMYRGRKWLYADHAIFAIHLHTFAFIIGLAGLILEAVFHNDVFMTIGWWLIFIYLVLALWNNYGQSFRKSLLKGILLGIAYLFTAGIVFAVYIVLIFTIFL